MRDDSMDGIIGLLLACRVSGLDTSYSFKHTRNAKSVHVMHS